MHVTIKSLVFYTKSSFLPQSPSLCCPFSAAPARSIAQHSEVNPHGADERHVAWLDVHRHGELDAAARAHTRENGIR